MKPEQTNWILVSSSVRDSARLRTRAVLALAMFSTMGGAGVCRGTPSRTLLSPSARLEALAIAPSLVYRDSSLSSCARIV